MTLVKCKYEELPEIANHLYNYIWPCQKQHTSIWFGLDF